AGHDEVHAFARIGPVADDIAEAIHLVHALFLDIVEDGLKGLEIAMDVADNRLHARGLRVVATSWCRTDVPIGPKAGQACLLIGHCEVYSRKGKGVKGQVYSLPSGRSGAVILAKTRTKRPGGFDLASGKIAQWI